VKLCMLAILLTLTTVCQAAPAAEYSIVAIRFADAPDDLISSLVIGAPKGETIDTVYVLWLIRGQGRNILFDSGFHRERWFELWTVKDYLRPDEAVRLAGVQPEQITPQTWLLKNAWQIW